MSEKSREEKLAAAKRKLKKFQDNNTKEKNVKNSISDHSFSNNQAHDLPVNSNFVQTDSDEFQTNITELISPQSSALDLEEPTITTESLKHISRHLNGIISCSSSSIDRDTQVEYMNTIRELEKRNIELASLNSQRAEQMETLHVKIANLNETLARLNKDRVTELSNLENSYKRQIDCNKDQFQAQIHTISLLVAEKSELQSQVTHNQKVVTQRQQEIEDITNKLKASRQKVGDLEKMLNDMKAKNDKLEEAYRDTSRQSEQLRNTIKKLKLEKEESASECSQLRSKLMSKTQETSNLELTLDDLKSHLEMSQVQIHHLTNSQEGHYENMYSQLKLTEQKNFELMQNLDSAKLQIQQADSQSTRIQNQYRNYFEQIEEKLRNLQAELSHSVEERNRLSTELDMLRRNVSDVKEDKHIDVIHLQNSISNLQQERESLLEVIRNYEISINDLRDTNSSLLNNNEQLAKVAEELEEKNLDLLEKNNQFQINKVDHIDLLQQLQSDKTALSRALAQNKQLKSQLVELQEAFVKLSSDNMDIATKLDHEKHVSKELSLRLGEQEDDLNEIRLIVANKDQELSRLIQSNKQITEELLTTSNSSDMTHLQRSESHFNMANKELIANLQVDISHLQEKINQLTTENNALRYNNHHHSEDVLLETKNVTSSEHDSFLNIALLQLEAERDELLAKFESHKIKEAELMRQLENYKEARDENDVIITNEKYQSLQLSMAQTNEKFYNIMECNIKLIEDNKRLEHIVAQLEGETDTIGEYISLYQHQRSMLKQRSLAKDQFMSKLMHRKQLLDSRLLTLENLINNITVQDDTMNSIQYSDSSVKEERVPNSKTVLIGQIFEIIHELQRPSDYMLQTLGQFSVETEMTTKSSDSFASDNLFHSEFIHCKCCVGKVIDL